MKKTIMSRSRRIMLSLILVFSIAAVASIIRVQAAGVVTGWLWGGSEDANIGGSLNTWPPDGNETGVGEIHMSGTAQDGTPYGVTIPSGDGIISGGKNFAWSETIGWIDFDGVMVTTVGQEKRLSGQARIIAIRDADANAGGWQGWIKLSGDGANWTGSSCAGNNNYNNNDRCNYGVKIDSSGNFSGYGWNGEEPGTGANIANGLGWINFSKAKLPMPIDGQCKTPPNNDSFCPGETPNPETMSAAELCNSYDPANPPSVLAVSGTWDWTCSGQNGGSPMPCLAELGVAIVPECNDDINFCTGNISSPCVSGTASAFSNEENYEASWTCTGSCPTTTIDCSAKGKKACGWIETN